MICCQNRCYLAQCSLGMQAQTSPLDHVRCGQNMQGMTSSNSKCHTHGIGLLKIVQNGVNPFKQSWNTPSLWAGNVKLID